MALDGFVISNIVYELNQNNFKCQDQQDRTAGKRRTALHLQRKQRAVPSCHVRKRIPAISISDRSE